MVVVVVYGGVQLVWCKYLVEEVVDDENVGLLVNQLESRVGRVDLAKKGVVEVRGHR